MLFTIYTVYKIKKVAQMPDKSKGDASAQQTQQQGQRVIPNEKQTIAELDS